MYLALFITKKCNLFCEFCGARPFTHDSVDMSLSKVKETIDKVSEIGCRYLCLSGGEPLCYSNLIDVIDYALKKGLWITITTNGTLINSEFIDFIKGKNVNLRVSFHTLDDVNYRMMTKVGSLSLLKDKIKLISNSGLFFSIGSTVYANNADEIPDLARYAYESGASYIRFTPVSGIQKGIVHETDSEFYKLAISKISRFILENKHIISFEKRNMGIGYDYLALMTTRQCAAASDAFYVYDSDYNMQVCQFMPSVSNYQIENVQPAGIIEGMKQLTEKKNQECGNVDVSSLKGFCNKCIYKWTCKGGCLANKMQHSLAVNDEQPICLYRIVKHVLSKMSESSKNYLLAYWYYYFTRGLDSEVGNFVCMRKSSVWEIHFKKRMGVSVNSDMEECRC